MSEGYKLEINGYTFWLTVGSSSEGVSVDLDDLANVTKPDYGQSLEIAMLLWSDANEYFIVTYGDKREYRPSYRPELPAYIEPHRKNFVAILQEKSAMYISIHAPRNGKKLAGYVYLLRDMNADGLCKIGYSINPTIRVGQISNATGKQIEIIHLIKTDDMKQLESDLHYRFRDKHLGNEWFDLSNNDVLAICAIEGIE